MGHYYSEMVDPSPIYTTKHLKDKESLCIGEKIMKKKKYWRKGGECYSVTYHEMKMDDRKWYEIHCRKNGMYFVRVSVEEWYSYNI